MRAFGYAQSGTLAGDPCLGLGRYHSLPHTSQLHGESMLSRDLYAAWEVSTAIGTLTLGGLVPENLRTSSADHLFGGNMTPADLVPRSQVGCLVIWGGQCWPLQDSTRLRWILLHLGGRVVCCAMVTARKLTGPHHVFGAAG